MLELTKISWFTFLIISLIIVLIWILTTRNRIGRMIIERETPWNTIQWSRILLAILITSFLLVNPIFHLSTAIIFGALYYLFVIQGFMQRNMIALNRGNDSKRSIKFSSDNKELHCLICTPEETQQINKARIALEKCLFSFNQVEDDLPPKIHFENGQFSVQLKINENYLASLSDYISKEGFQVTKSK